MLRKFTLGAVLTLIGLTTISPVHAATWDGGGTDANWMTANNWNPNGTPTAGDALTFPTSTFRLFCNNDFPALTSFGPLTLMAANYSLGGNDIVLQNGILSSQPSGS